MVNDTAGNMLDDIVHSADIQDQDGVPSSSTALIKPPLRYKRSIPMAAMGGEDKFRQPISDIKEQIIEIVKRPKTYKA